MSIYANLFGYRPRPSRNPLEDFLSAALADLLNRLSHQEHVVFVADVLLTGETAERWREYMAARPAARLRWQLQHYVTDRTTRGIVDLVLLVDEHPAIAVENKIGAPLRTHAFSELTAQASKDGSSSRHDPDTTQLHTYGRWLLDMRQNDAWGGVLVMLTHLTPPPPDFLTYPSSDFGPGKYGVSHRAVCRWRQIWHWARKADDEMAVQTAPAAKQLTLKAELADFLEERNMGGDQLTSNDVAAMSSYFGAVRKVERTLTDVADKLSQVRAQLGMGNVSPINYTSLMACAWSWSYLSGPPGQKWYLGWGIRFPEHSDRHWKKFQPPLPDVPHVFLVLGTEGKAIPLEKLPDALPQGWIPTGKSEAVIGYPLDSFLPSSEKFTEAVAKWIEQEMVLLHPVIKKLLEATSSP